MRLFNRVFGYKPLIAETPIHCFIVRISDMKDDIPCNIFYRPIISEFLRTFNLRYDEVLTKETHLTQ